MSQKDTNRKFSNAKIGDRVYNILLGEWGIITSIDPNKLYSIRVRYNDYSNCYTLDGKAYAIDNNPTLFWNEVKLPTTEEDKPPFDLEKFIVENLEPVPYDDRNYEEIFTIFYDGVHHERRIQSSLVYIPGALYFKTKSDISWDDILSTLSQNAVSWKQLDNVYNKLGWV